MKNNWGIVRWRIKIIVFILVCLSWEKTTKCKENETKETFKIQSKAKLYCNQIPIGRKNVGNKKIVNDKTNV
jgi:hypothetical protein